MAWFKCLVRGENFPVDLGEPGLAGFYTVRFVRAVDADAAELAALAGLRAEPKLAAPPGFTPTGTTRVFFEAVTEVPAGAVPAVPPGFIWYPMDAG